MNKRNLKAVILAGGKGTRLYPITYEIPKPLLPVKRKPIINYLVDLFSKQGIKEIFILISKDFKKDFKWWKKRYYSKKSIQFIEEEKPLGTFGGLHYLKDKLSDNFFLTNGDELKEVNLKEMTDFHQSHDNPATLALVKVEKPQDYGVVICENGIVKMFLEKPEKPPTNYISSGLYLLNKKVFKYHPGLKFSMIEKDLFPKLAQKKKLSGFKFEGKWTDCGTWERYEEALNNWKK